jgi:putative ABC transport system permease protein
LTGLSSALVAALLVATAAFVRGLERTFAGAAQDDTVLLLSTVADRDLVRSTTVAGLAGLVKASVPGVVVASDEIHMGTSLTLTGHSEPLAGFVRGVTESAYETHDAVTLVEGRLPGPGEVMVGRLVPRQLGVREDELELGAKLVLEGAEHTVVGKFVAPGTTIEAELWTPLEPLRGLARRDDSSAVFVRIDGADAYKRLKLFADRRLDLELEVVTSAEYYSELAALRAVGYGVLDLTRSLLTESVLLGAAGAVVGLWVAHIAIAGSGVRLAMSAFSLEVDAVSVLIGLSDALALSVAAVIPASLKVARLPISAALAED